MCIHIDNSYYLPVPFLYSKGLTVESLFPIYSECDDDVKYECINVGNSKRWMCWRGKNKKDWGYGITKALALKDLEELELWLNIMQKGKTND